MTTAIILCTGLICATVVICFYIKSKTKIEQYNDYVSVRTIMSIIEGKMNGIYRCQKASEDSMNKVVELLTNIAKYTKDTNSTTCLTLDRLERVQHGTESNNKILSNLEEIGKNLRELEGLSHNKVEKIENWVKANNGVLCATVDTLVGIEQKLTDNNTDSDGERTDN